jgi:hypothetical protein
MERFSADFVKALMNAQRPTDEELGGMTVNERLFVCGVLDKWEDAAMRRCRQDMIEVLRSVAMTEQQAEWTTDTVLKNPKQYGF